MAVKKPSRRAKPAQLKSAPTPIEFPDTLVCVYPLFRVRNLSTQELYFASSRTQLMSFLVGAGKDWKDFTVTFGNFPMEVVY